MHSPIPAHTHAAAALLAFAALLALAQASQYGCHCDNYYYCSFPNGSKYTNYFGSNNATCAKGNGTWTLVGTKFYFDCPGFFDYCSQCKMIQDPYANPPNDPGGVGVCSLSLWRVTILLLLVFISTVIFVLVMVYPVRRLRQYFGMCQRAKESKKADVDGRPQGPVAYCEAGDASGRAADDENAPRDVYLCEVEPPQADLDELGDEKQRDDNDDVEKQKTRKCLGVWPWKRRQLHHENDPQDQLELGRISADTRVSDDTSPITRLSDERPPTQQDDQQQRRES